MEQLAKVLPNTQNYAVDFGFMGWGVEYVDLIVLVRGCEGAERHTAPGMCAVAEWPAAALAPTLIVVSSLSAGQPCRRA